MNKVTIIFLLFLFPIFLASQTVEVNGSLKVMVMDTLNAEDQLVVLGSDGTLATRLVSTLTDNNTAGRTLDSDLLLMSYLCENPMLPASILNTYLNNGYTAQELDEFGISLQALVNAGLSVQNLLDAGVTPLSLVAEGFSQDSLYGKTYQGGLIFFYNTDGTGLVAAPADNGSSEWGCQGTTAIPAGNSPFVGAGVSNTAAILATCTTPGIAADICNNLSLGGYDDWFLPTYFEMTSMYVKIGQGAPAPNTNIGNLSNSYWCSWELSATEAHGWNFSSNTVVIDTKSTVHLVRAVRAF